MTKKQANVIFALSKKGDLKVSSTQIKRIYEEVDMTFEMLACREQSYGGTGRTHGVKTYFADERSLFDAIFSGNFEKANQLIIDLFGN